MIFGKGYDVSLLMMLYSDNANRDRIWGFVKSVPEELYEQIQCSLSLHEHHKEMNSRLGVSSNIELHGRVETDDRILYWFFIDPYCSKLTVGYSIYDGHNYDEAFEISLFPFNKKLTHEYKNILIGNMKDHYRKMSEGMPIYSLVDYDLEKDFLGWKIVCSSSNRECSKRIDPDMLADTISIDGIMSRKDIKKLVRSKNNVLRGNK